MAEASYVFGASETARIAAAVRAVEGARTDSTESSRTNRAPWDVVIVRVVSNAPGGGKYVVKFVLPPTDDVATSGALSADEVGQSHTPEYGSALLCHLPEVAQGTHDLVAGDCLIAKIVRRQQSGQIVVQAGSALRLPVPQYVGMVLCSVAQSVLGADYLFAVVPPT